MKLIIAGRDRTEDLGRDLRRQVAAMDRLEPARQPARLPADISALALARAMSDTDYLDQYLRLIRHREAVGTYDFNIPHKAGPAGWCLAGFKALLWKLLRYQHDRINFRQYLINNQLTSALLLEVAARQKDVADLERRVAELEGEGLPANHAKKTRN